MNVFPNFNAWHKVPEDATIPAGTPYWRYVSEEGEGWYYGHGVHGDLDPSERHPFVDYYTEERIPSPEEEVIVNRSRNMYFLAGGTGWEYESLATKEKWHNLATKYTEK